MLGRSVVLGVFIAAMPLAVDLPGAADSSRGTSVTVAGGGGQFALVGHSCAGRNPPTTHNPLLSGALVVQQPLPGDYVVGIRAGSIRTDLHTAMWGYGGPHDFVDRETTLVDRYANSYANPYIAYEGRGSGIGVGWLVTDRPLVMSSDSHWRSHTTWHVYFGDELGRLTLRWMEDVPLESEGHFSIDVGSRRSERFEMGIFAGMAGPYDIAMAGVRGRVWITPAAAAQIKASLGANSQHGVYGSITTQLPGPR